MSSEKRQSLRDHIDRMCKHCIYDPGKGNGTWRQQVEACTSPNCPLYEVRPRLASDTQVVELRAAA